MDTVNGNDILLFLADNDTTPTAWYPIMCLTNLTWGRSKSTTQTKTKCGTFDSVGSTDYTSTASGIIIENADANDIGHIDLISLFTSAVKRLMRIGPATPVAGNIIRQFKGSLSTLNDAFPTDGMATFDVTLTVDPTTVVETEYAAVGNILSSISVASGSVAKSAVKQILYIGKLINLASQTPSAIASALTGTWDASDLAKVELYTNGNAAIDGSEVLVESKTTASDTAPHMYSFANSTPLAAGTHYFIVTADIASGADTGHTAIAGKLTFTGLTGTIEDDQTATGGTKTISA
jgi:hypothetical protein